MDFFTSLLKTYENAEAEGWVDNASKGTVLLPIYHGSKNASNELIIAVTLDNKGEFIKADFLENDGIIIFPMTTSSAIRTSNSVPHPLVDQMKYLTSEVKPSLNSEYHTQLNKWIEFTDNDEVRNYLRLIQTFLKDDTFLDKIFDSLYGKGYSRQGLKIELKNNQNKKNVVDFTKCYIEFKIDEFVGRKTVSVTNYLELHQDYIRYVNSKQDKTIICNISGREEGVLQKHRGVIGTAKLISGDGGSVNTENYLGRFTDIENVIQIGYQTSEKIHLMLKFLSENQNTHTNIGTLRMLNWFNDDMVNDSVLDVLYPQTDDNDFFDWDNMYSAIEFVEDKKKFQANKMTKIRGQVWIHGEKKFSDSANYHIALLDKSTDGRTALKYYRELQASELLDNLEKWQDKYSWEKSTKGQLFIPRLQELIYVAYGVEREDRTKTKQLQFDNDGLKRNQFQHLITSVINGQDMPSFIVKKLEDNIKQRHKYPDLWYRVERTALAVLHKQNGKEFTPMLDRENSDRSYLFGRLLAIYELIEKVYNNSKNPDKKDDKRFTNAERYWTSYSNQPGTMMKLLEDKVRYCIDYLQTNEVGYWKKLDNERQEIIEKLAPSIVEKEVNQPLDYKFIFGYYAEKKSYYTPKANAESEE